MPPGSGAGQCTGFARCRLGSQSLSVLSLSSEWPAMIISTHYKAIPIRRVCARCGNGGYFGTKCICCSGAGQCCNTPPQFSRYSSPDSPIRVEGGFKKRARRGRSADRERKKLRWRGTDPWSDMQEQTSLKLLLHPPIALAPLGSSR